MMKPRTTGISEQSRVSAPRLSLGHLGVALFVGADLMLASHLVVYLKFALAAIPYPYQLDYGEGIVWQQALLIPGQRMYGDITKYPFIVFHYPPLYHLLARAVAALGPDLLTTGRAISAASTVATAVLVTRLALDATRVDAGRLAALVGASIAGLSVFCYWPIVVWSPLFRVDMLAVVLSFFGVWCAVRSGGRLVWLSAAFMIFVLAGFTKQTCVAAPLSTFAIMLFLYRADALKALIPGLLFCAAGLLVMEWATSGGFLRHIVFYNVNRYNLHRAFVNMLQVYPNAVFVLLAVVALCFGWRRTAVQDKGSLAGLRHNLLSSRSALTMAVLTAYFVASSIVTLISVGKSGAAYNYFIEWLCVTSVLVGACVTHLLHMANTWMPRTSIPETIAILVVPILLMLQVAILPGSASSVFQISDATRNARLDQLVTKVARASKPVLSDDMVILLRAGREVPWEPAVFSELASTGRWDERLITNMIWSREFAYIITTGYPGQHEYDSRYDPDVTRAIEASYPYTVEYAGRVVHRPAAQ